MSQPQHFQSPLAGLLTAQFFGAFNDNAMKLMVALLAGGVAARGFSDTVAQEMARQEQTTIAFVAFTLPLMVFSLPSALLADRFSKRSMIIAMKWFELVLMLAGTAVLLAWPEGGWWLMGVLMLMGLQSALFSPVKYGIMPQLCDEATISRGNALLQLWTFVAIIAGYAAGGALLDATRPYNFLAMAVLAALSLVGLAASFRVPRVPAVGAEVGMPLRGAWDAIRKDRALQLVIAGETVFWTIASLLGQDVLTYAKEVLEMGDTLAGVTYAMFGIGVGVGALWAGRLSPERIEPGLIPFGAIGLALGTTLLGLLSPGYGLTLTLMGLIGVAAGVMIVPLESLLQWLSPPDKRGAVIAIGNVPVFLGVMVGSLAVYFLAIVWKYNASDILVLAGLLTSAATLWALWLLPKALSRMVVVVLANTLYRLRVEGRHHLPAQGGALIVVNHTSLVDWVFLVASCDRPIRFLVDSGYYHHWLLWPVMRVIGAMPVSAGSQRDLLRAMKKAGEYLAAGEVVCIFAEGEITRTGSLLPFRRGLTRILKGNEHVPVIPAHLDNVWGSPFSPSNGGFLRTWNGPIPRPITLSFGEPLPADTPVEEVRMQVKLLDERAWRLRQAWRTPLHHTLVRTCRRQPFRLAIADTTGKRANRIQMLTGAVLLARKLRAAWGDQEYVGILLPPTVGCAVVNLAAAFSGRISVNVNYTAGIEGLQVAARQASLRTVVTTRAFLDKIGLELPEGLTPILLDEVKAAVTRGEKLWASLAAWFLPARSLESFAGAIKHPRIDDVVTVIFSSGSTGEPKGVMLTHSNVDANAEAVTQILRLHKQDRVLGVLPQFHSFGYMAMWFCCNGNVPVLCHGNPTDAAAIGPLVEKEKVTIVIATPTFLQIWMRRCDPRQFGSVRMVITGAEKLPQRIADAFHDRFGVRPLEGYGCSECAPVVAVSTDPYRAAGYFQAGSRRGSIGQPLPGVAVCVVDPDTFAPLPHGEAGMLLVKGSNVMKGYLGRPDLTEQAMHDGWYVTGDIARIDEDGFIWITDRLARFSKIGGEMVPHGRIEDVLHELVGELERQVFCVTGVADAKKGERLAVLHTMDPSRVPGLLKEMAERGLPNLFIPKEDQFVAVDAIPVLGTGKIDLRRVREIAEAELGVQAR